MKTPEARLATFGTDVSRLDIYPDRVVAEVSGRATTVLLSSIVTIEAVRVPSRAAVVLTTTCGHLVEVPIDGVQVQDVLDVVRECIELHNGVPVGGTLRRDGRRYATDRGESPAHQRATRTSVDA